MSTKNETKLTTTHEAIYSALLPVAVELHNAACDIQLKVREVAFHFGDPKQFETSKARADLCYIRDREYCSTAASHVYLNPSIGDYPAALAALCAGLVLHYSPDIRARIACAKSGKDAETKLNLVGKILAAMQFSIQGRKNSPKWVNGSDDVNAKVAAIAETFGDYPEPVTLPKKTTTKVQGTRRERLECSAGCNGKVKGSKEPVPVHLYASTAEAAKWVGTPCRTRFKNGKLVPGCKGTMQPVAKATKSRKVETTTKVA